MLPKVKRIAPVRTTAPNLAQRRESNQVAISQLSGNQLGMDCRTFLLDAGWVTGRSNEAAQALQLKERVLKDLDLQPVAPSGFRSLACDYGWRIGWRATY